MATRPGKDPLIAYLRRPSRRRLGRARSLKRSADKRKQREEAHACRELEPPGAADELEALHEAISGLPADLRLAIELRCLARLPIQDVAEALEISDRAVQSRIEKARGLIKRRLARCAPGAALFGLESAGNAAPTPPVKLLPGLLKIVERGSALAPAAAGSGILALGAFIMAKKVLVSVGLAVILLLGVGGGLLWRSGSPLEEKASLEPVAEPAVVDAGTGDAPRREASIEAASARSAAVAPPYAELRGLVLHESGAPLAGARVRYVDSIRPEEVKDLTERGFPDVREGEVSLETVSNGGGEFAFTGLFPGRAYVNAEKESVFMQGMVKVELKAGEASWKELRLQDQLRVTGSIRDKDGAVPVGGIVFLQAHQIKNPPMKLGTMDYVEFGGFPADSNGGYDSGFRLTIQKGHGVALSAWAQGCGIATREIQLSDFAGLEARVDFELKPERPVFVLVTTLDGKPVEGAAVGVGDEDGIYSSAFPYPAAFTDSRGSARLEHLAPREQPIRVDGEGYHTASVKVGPGGPEVFHITLQPLGHPITGRVVFEGDTLLMPRQAVQVSLVHMNGEEKLMSLRGSNETSDREALVYTYRPRGPGRYRFEYRHGDEDYQTEPFDYTGAEPMDVKLPVELKLRPPYVSGIVLRAETGEPLPDAVVEAHYFPRGKEPSRWGGGAFIHLGYQRDHFFPPPPGRLSEARSGPDGRFLIPLPREGGSTVILQARSSAVWWHGPENEKLWWSEEVVLDVAETDAIADARMEVKDGGSIEGLVLDGGGDPQAGEVVAVYSGAVVACRTSNAEGRFRFGRLPAGTYAVEPLGTTSSLRVGSGSGGQDGEDLPRPEDIFERKVLVENGKATQVTIDLAKERLGILEGTVAEDLVSGPGVHFGMVLGGRPRQGLPFGGDRELSGRTFRIEGLHPGVYRVWVRDGGGLGKTIAAAEADVRRGQTARIALVSPSGVLSVPLPGLEEALREKIQVVKARRLSHIDAGGKMLWESVGGFEVEREPESLRVKKLLAGSVQVALYTPGFREAWTEAVPVREGALSISLPLRFERGSRIVVHVEGSDEEPVPDALRFRVFREDEGEDEVGCTVERVSGQPAWMLSSFGEGAHHVIAFLEEHRAGFVAVQVPADQDVEAVLRLEGSE